MSNPSKAPSALLLAAEPLRAGLDALALLVSNGPLKKGQGQPVVVYPGLATNEISTALFRKKLASAGFEVHDWDQGVNRGPQGDFEAWIAMLGRQVDRLADLHGEPVALVGWSLGGVFAREIARRMPNKVSQVITLGTPFAATAESTNAGKVYELLNGQAPEFTEGFMESLRETPPVPTTSVYSKSDGVVAWGCCVERETSTSQNIELNQVSHFGMVLHPQVLSVVADRLAQPRGTWVRYRHNKSSGHRASKQPTPVV